MAGWYDTMRRRWGYNNIPENKEINQGETADTSTQKTDSQQSATQKPASQQTSTQQPEVQTPDNPVKEPTNQTTSDTPQLSEAGWFNDFYQKNMVAPITPEEEQRRIRGAQAAQSIGHLGNVLSSFSNLLFTDKGAPSQTLPNVPDLNIKTFEDRIAEKRRQYIAGAQAANEIGRKAIIDNFNMRLQKEKVDMQKEKLEMEKLINNAKLEGINAENQLNELKAKYQELRNKGYEQEQAAKIALLEAQKDAQKAAAARSLAQAENEWKVVDSAIGSDGKIYTRNTKLSENEAMQIVQSVGVDDEHIAPYITEKKDRYGNVIGEDIDWVAAANYALQNGMVNKNELLNRGFKLSDKSADEGWSSSDYKEQPKKEQPKLILK